MLEFDFNPRHWTPLHHAKNLGASVGLNELYVKDESLNPTQSFKARGMSVAVSMAKELGVKKIAAPSAGNAAGALAAYCALGGIQAFLFMPRDTPRANLIECEVAGACQVQVVSSQTQATNASVATMPPAGTRKVASEASRLRRSSGRATQMAI